MAACDDTVYSVEQLELDSAGEPGPSSHSTKAIILSSVQRKVKTNPPVGAKRSQRGHSLLSQTYTLKSVLLAKCVRVYPDKA